MPDLWFFEYTEKRQKGKQRYQYQDCYAYFSLRNEGVRLKNQFIWFRKWVMERQDYTTLVRDSGLSQSSIQSLFRKYLQKVPVVGIKSKWYIHFKNH